MALNLVAQNKSFGGWHKQFFHVAESTHCKMRFAIYLPPQANHTSVPVLYWLSGLTCTDENFMHKSGVQKMAAELGLAIVACDTSPRGEAGKDVSGHQIADDENYDLGQGAGFYVNATEPPWKPHYTMYRYVVDELPALIEANFPVTARKAIAGHSMGGHGAITIALRNPQNYCSVSAFSPIANPMNCPWGEKAFAAYLGQQREDWVMYDSCELMRSVKNPATYPPLLVDQGLADDFLGEQLKPDALELAALESGYSLELRRHEDYDHSYYFIASFLEDHLRFHEAHLRS